MAAASPAPPPHRTVTFEREAVRAVIDLDAGCRCASFAVSGRELLIQRAPEREPFLWGSFPMAPFAGRLRRGQLHFEGRTWQLPQNEPPHHAIHGYAWARSWRQVDASTFSVRIAEPWPFPFTLVQRVALDDESLTFELELRPDERMPAVVGWHPWFARRPERVCAPEERAGGPAPSPEPGPAELSFRAGSMYVRDDDFIPTGERVPPPPGPWVDCFTDLDGPPVLRWPGFLELAVESSCPDYVIYDRPEHAICVEPQSGPPDGPNFEPSVVEPGASLPATMTWRWRRLDR